MSASSPPPPAWTRQHFPIPSCIISISATCSCLVGISPDPVAIVACFLPHQKPGKRTLNMDFTAGAYPGGGSIQVVQAPPFGENFVFEYKFPGVRCWTPLFMPLDPIYIPGSSPAQAAHTRTMLASRRNLHGPFCTGFCLTLALDCEYPLLVIF